MVYYAVCGFLLPILLRLGWYKKSFWGILIPTFCTYAAWYVTSFFLIEIGCSNVYYIWIFAIFPITLILYEVFNFQRMVWIKKTKINTNYYLSAVVIILIFALCNLLTFKYFLDVNFYYKLGANFYQNNIYATGAVYRFNSFYYLASMFGLYNVQFFYAVFAPYAFGVITLLLVLDFVKQKHKQVYKWHFVLLTTFLIGLLVNTADAIEVNWITGVPVILALLNLCLVKKNAKEMMVFDLLIFFLLNFSVSAVVIGLFLSMVLKFKSIWTDKKVFSLSSFLPLLFVAVVFLFPNQSKPTKIAPSFFFLSFALAGIFYFISREWKIDSFIKKIVKVYDFHSLLIWIKKEKFLLLNSLCLITCVPLFILIILYKDPTNLSQNHHFFSSKSGYPFVFFPKLQYQTNTTIFIATTLVTGVLIILLLNFWMWVGMDYVILIMFFLTGEFCAYFFLESVSIPFLTQRVPNYLSYRVLYATSFFIILMFFLGAFVFANNKLKKAPFFLLPIMACFSAVFPLSVINPVFNFSIVKNNRQISKVDLNFFLKNQKFFFEDNNKIYSEIDLPLRWNYPLLYYDRVIMTNHNRKGVSVFDFLSWQFGKKLENRKINWLVDRNNYYLEKGLFFNVLVLGKNSVWLKTISKKKYRKVAYNKNDGLSIWLSTLNQH